MRFSKKIMAACEDLRIDLMKLEFCFGSDGFIMDADFL